MKFRGSLPKADRAEGASCSDAELVSFALRGDRASEERLYVRHAKGVFHLAARLLRSSDEARDVTHDAFVIALEDLRTLRDPNTFRFWVNGIAVHLVHRRFRRRALLRPLGLDRGRDVTPLDELVDESAATEARAELRLLEDAMTKVRPEERAAWILRHVEGHSLEEVAALVGCSLATAKRRIRAGDLAIEKHVEQDDGFAAVTERSPYAEEAIP